jgi:hypothetical protein
MSDKPKRGLFDPITRVTIIDEMNDPIRVLVASRMKKITERLRDKAKREMAAMGYNPLPHEQPNFEYDPE